MSDGEPSLKCVIAWSDTRNLCTLVSERLGAEVGVSDIRRFGEDAFAIYGTAPPDVIRNCVADVLDADAGESVVVFEFEKWSGCGSGVDAEWLMRRGH
jgi:hypothetical protein